MCAVDPTQHGAMVAIDRKARIMSIWLNDANHFGADPRLPRFTTLSNWFVTHIEE
jgi:hypothetical protein